MPPLADALREAVPLLALVALLATAYAHPTPRIEALVSALATAAAAATGILGADQIAATVRELAPVVIFLVTILVVADVCGRAGLFTAAARVVRDASGASPPRLLVGVVALAALVTAVLSLDATVVLLTPVVVGAAVALGTSSRPGAYACLRMANSASLLLPVSNLTNLLALPYVDLTFGGFARVMAPVWVVVVVLEYAVLRWLFRRELAPVAPATAPDEAGDLDHLHDPEAPRPTVPWVPLVVVGAMLVGFAALSPLGVEPCWVSAAAAVVLVGWARRHRLLSVRRAVAAGNPSFALFVLALGVVVATLSTGFLGDLVTRVLPGSTSYVSLLGIAVIATVLANLLTNLSATLLVVPLLAPLGAPAVLAALLGLNIGSGLTVTGSLANLLWRRGMDRHGEHPGMAEFHRVSLVATPLVLLAAVTTLALVT